MQRLFPSVCAALTGLFWPALAGALTAQAELDLPPDAVFAGAKRHLLVQLLPKGKTPADLIRLEDGTAGLLRFVYDDGTYRDENALIEVTELNIDHSRLKVTLPGDFGGRAELLLQKIRQSVLRTVDASRADDLPFEASRVYRSALRHVLKSFVTGSEKKDDVVRVAAEEIGLIHFVYRDGKFRDPSARVEVLPSAKGSCRLVVSVPSDPGRQILLQSEFRAAVRTDLGERPAEGSSETIE
jgi:hypothetical protein